MDDAFLSEIADKAIRRMWRKFAAGEIDDPELKSAMAELAEPWVAARLREGRTINDIDDMITQDALIARRVSAIFEAAYPRLIDQAVEEEVADLVSRGELVEETSEDGKTHFYRPDD